MQACNPHVGHRILRGESVVKKEHNAFKRMQDDDLTIVQKLNAICWFVEIARRCRRQETRRELLRNDRARGQSRRQRRARACAVGRGVTKMTEAEDTDKPVSREILVSAVPFVGKTVTFHNRTIGGATVIALTTV